MTQRRPKQLLRGFASKAAGLITALSAIGLGCNPAAPLVEPEEAERFLFASDRTGTLELYRYGRNSATSLTDDPDYDSWWPRLSPNGRRVLFYRSDVADRPAQGNGQGNYEYAALWSMNSDGTGARELIPVGAYGWTHQGVADWSPDGSRLVMAAIDPGEGRGRWHLYVTDAEGDNPTRVSRRDGLYLDPSWSPDGERIVYVAYPEGFDGFDLSQLEVFTMRADGTDERRLTDDDLRDHDPYWSPDGTEIAFETAVDPGFLLVGKWALRSVRPDGSSLRTILDDGNINTLPRWSHDGTSVLFHRLEFFTDIKFAIARIDRDGRGLVRLTPGGKEYDDVDASPY